uniref:Uncharacterized protein n=1 Tax=Glossina austeni TaxID=7395 RepID=A0A1A9VNP7_GLOAU
MLGSLSTKDVCRTEKKKKIVVSSCADSSCRHFCVCERLLIGSACLTRTPVRPFSKCNSPSRNFKGANGGIPYSGQPQGICMANLRKNRRIFQDKTKRGPTKDDALEVSRSLPPTATVANTKTIRKRIILLNGTGTAFYPLILVLKLKIHGAGVGLHLLFELPNIASAFHNFLPFSNSLTCAPLPKIPPMPEVTPPKFTTALKLYIFIEPKNMGILYLKEPCIDKLCTVKSKGPEPS